MAEAGTPQPDGPRPPTPRPRGDRGRDPAALAAWRRVAEQRRRAGDRTTSPADPSTAEPAAVGPPVVEEPEAEPSVVEAPAVERPAATRPAADRPAATRPAAERAATARPGVAEPAADRPATAGPAADRTATARPAADRPAAAEPAADRPAAAEPAADRPAVARPAAARPAVARPAADRPAAARPAVERPVDRPSGPRPVVDRPAPSRPAASRPAAQDPAPARPTATGTGDDLVRAVRDDHAHGGESARPETRPAPPTARENPPSAPSRPGPDGGPPPPGRLHDVLLGLAGRLDDDALTSVREMVAAEDDAEAAELLGGCLLAGGIGLTGEERAVLRPWFTAARVDPELLGMLPSDTGALDRSVHRFVTAAPDRAPGIPLARAARRLSGVVAVRESWRVTPAGSAPGPVPHRVVLVETVGADDCDHVVHHLAHAARALDDTSVEVFATGAGLPAYHRAALAVARPLVAEDAAATTTAAPVAPARATPSAPVRSAPPTVARPVPPRTGPPAQRFGAAEDDETWRTVADAGSSRTGPAPVAVPPEPADVDVDADEPELVDLDEPEPEPEAEAADPDEAEEAPAARVVAPQRPTSPTRPPAAPVEPPPDRAGPARPARPAADGAPRPAKPPAPPATSIDEDLSSTARRIAALWARPSPEDFSAPLPADSLEPTHLEPEREDDPADPEDEAPSGRHGRPAVADMGTTSFRSPRTRSRTNGHPVPRSVEPAEGREDTGPPGPDPAPTSTPADDDTADPDSAQLPRTRHRRPRDGDVPQPPDTGPARFGHDARFGAGPGPAWPGGPVTGDTRPGPDTLFTSPVEVGEEPVSLGTNGHRHEPEPDPYDDEPDTLGTNGHRHEPVVAAVDDEPDTGPIAWASPAGPGPVAPPPPPRVVGPPPGAGPSVVPPPPPGTPVGRPPAGGPRRPGDPGDTGYEAAPPWAADEAGWVPDGAHAPDPDAASWAPDDDSVAQLSDRERELLARLHEELAQRERSEGADPFAPPRPTRNRFRPRPGSPGGRVNGHGLPPGGPDDASA